MMTEKLRHGGGRAFRAAEEAERRGDPLDLPDFVRDAGSFTPQAPPRSSGLPAGRPKRRWLRSRGGVQS